ncbi:ECF-type sigma factor [Stieleria varia]|uniref:ECF sigma factor n=1 Tax=Stieleria varia TaxID=2528005 RepID=A0A5C6B1Q5_9BACT|nr:ECF-type sigma factor [Stieleria varia]TWU06063.1 ECF sigma factor [Stieleria varia]
MAEQITELLHAAELGDPEAKNRLFERVYADLRAMASQWLAREKSGNTLQPSALVNEVYLRVFRRADTDRDTEKDSERSSSPRQWEGRRHFFAAAANAMRQILVDAARRKTRVKRGGDISRILIDPNEISAPEMAGQLIALDDAMTALETAEPQIAELVRLRFFAGLTLREAAEELGIGRRTADGYWAYAKAWLLAEMTDADDEQDTFERKNRAS